MKSKDQIALEHLYRSIYQPKAIISELEILDEHGIWKKVAPLAVAAALGSSAFANDTKTVSPFDVTKNDVVYAKTINAYNAHEMSIDNVTKQLKQTLETQAGNKITKLTVEVTERKDIKDNYTDVVISVLGEVLASSQEEANNIALRTVNNALTDANIQLDDLQVVVENEQQLYSIKIKIHFKI